MRERGAAKIEPILSRETRLKEILRRSDTQKILSPFLPGLMPYSAPLSFTGGIGDTEVTLNTPTDLLLPMAGGLRSPLLSGEAGEEGGYGPINIPEGNQICSLAAPTTLSFVGNAAGTYFISGYGTQVDENAVVKDIPTLTYPGAGVGQQHRDHFAHTLPDGTAIPRLDYDGSLVQETVTELVDRVGLGIYAEGSHEGSGLVPIIKVTWDGNFITDISVVINIVTIGEEVVVDYLITDADYPDGTNYKDYRGQNLADIIIAKEHPTNNRKITLGERDHGTVVVIKSTPTINAKINSPDSKPISITDEIWEAEGEDGSFTNVNVKAGAGDSVFGVEVRTWEFVQLVFIEGLGWHRLNDSAELWSLIDDANTRIDGVDTRIDGVDIRIDGVDARIDGIDDRIDGVDTRIDVVEAKRQEVVRFDCLYYLYRYMGQTGERNQGITGYVDGRSDVLGYVAENITIPSGHRMVVDSSSLLAYAAGVNQYGHGLVVPPRYGDTQFSLHFVNSRSIRENETQLHIFKAVPRNAYTPSVNIENSAGDRLGDTWYQSAYQNSYSFTIFENTGAQNERVSIKLVLFKDINFNGGNNYGGPADPWTVYDVFHEYRQTDGTLLTPPPEIRDGHVSYRIEPI